MLFVKQVAIQPQPRLLGALRLKAQLIHLGQLAVAQRVYFQHFAIGENAEVAFGMVLIAQVAGQFVPAVGAALIV